MLRNAFFPTCWESGSRFWSISATYCLFSKGYQENDGHLKTFICYVIYDSQLNIPIYHCSNENCRRIWIHPIVSNSRLATMLRFLWRPVMICDGLRCFFMLKTTRKWPITLLRVAGPFGMLWTTQSVRCKKEITYSGHPCLHETTI